MIRMSPLIPTRSAIARLRKDGIVEIRVADSHTCSVDDAREVAAVIATLGDMKPMPVLRIAGKFSSVGPGVREFLASEQSQQNLLADAIVVNSLSQYLLGTLYLNFNKPRKPTRIFISVKEAEGWLRDFIPCLN